MLRLGRRSLDLDWLINEWSIREHKDIGKDPKQTQDEANDDKLSGLQHRRVLHYLGGLIRIAQGYKNGEASACY